MKMTKKSSWRLRLGSACLCVLLMAGVAWGAGLFDRDDQDIRGFWTFRQNVDFKGDVSIDGSLSAQQYSSVFYVHSGTGGDVPQFGKSRMSPFATVEYAIQRCTADRGDIIVVMPGHNEDISDAAGTANTGGFDADVAGISIIGFGRGSNRPTFDFDETDSTIAIGADNVTLQGLRFRPGNGNVVMGISIEGGADYAAFIDCEFGYQEASTDEFLIALNVATASHVTVDGCLFNAGVDDGAAHGVKFAQTTVGAIIKNNTFWGDYSVACLGSTAVAVEELLVDRNFLYNGDPRDGTSDLNALPVIAFYTGTTGIISNNLAICDVATATASIIADDCYYHNNYYNELEGGTYTSIITGSTS